MFNPDFYPTPPDFRALCVKIIELWDADCDIDVEINELRAVLARWGNTTPQPVPVSERLPDAIRMDALRDQSWDLRCFDMPTGQGDADIGWRVVGHFQAPPRERVIAEVYIDDPRAAIDAALASLNIALSLPIPGDNQQGDCDHAV